MLLLRYQRQRQADAEEAGPPRSPEHEVRRKITDRDLKGESHRAATRGTLVCIFVCGSALLSLGLGVLMVGLYVARRDPTPWMVIGPTCIVLGVLVLLLSVEIILKLRKISSSSGSNSVSSADKELGKKTPSKQSLVMSEHPGAALSIPPVIFHPATPLQQLSAASLPVPLEVVQHR